jgi:hypothetical protein
MRTCLVHRRSDKEVKDGARNDVRDDVRDGVRDEA